MDHGAGTISSIGRFLPQLALLTPFILLCWTLGESRSPAQFPVDLIPTYIAGKLWLSGATDSIYHGGAWLNEASVSPEWLAAARETGMRLANTAFVYSPVYLALMLPLVALTTPAQFFWVFATLNAVAGLAIGLESSRLAGVTQAWLRWTIAVAAALSIPASYAATAGQNVIVAAALVLYGFRCFAGDRPVSGTALLLLACACKPWCVLLLGVLAIARRWRQFVAAAAAYAGIFFVLPRLLFPADLVAGHERVLAALTKTSVLAYNNVSLRALIERLSVGDWTPQALDWTNDRLIGNSELALELAPVGILGLAFLFLAWKQPRFELIYTAAMVLALLPLSVCWSHYLVFALPFVCLALFDTRSPPWARLLSALLAVWLMQAIPSTVPRLLNMRPPSLWALLLGAPLLLSTAVVFVTLYRHRWRAEIRGPKTASRPAAPGL